MATDMVKQDINFMEYPIWFQDNKDLDSKQWKDIDGYTYLAGYRAPVKTDYLIMMCLLKLCQNQEWNPNIEFSKYSLLKTCGIKPNTREYKRVEDSLDRWISVVIKFEGIFYNGIKYDSLNFNIINNWDRVGTKILVELNKNWIIKIRDSEFFKLVNFNHLKKLRSPLNIRLYEILSKSFYQRNKWTIDAHKLAQKIPMKEQYLSLIVRKIKSSLTRINTETDLKLFLKVEKISRGKAMLTFTKKSLCKNKLADGTKVEYNGREYTIQLNSIITDKGTITIGNIKRFYKSGKIKIID